MDLKEPDSSTFIPSPALVDIKQKVFNNNLILKEIIKKFKNSTDLVNCRLVNKSWKRFATQHLQIKNWDERNFLVFLSAGKIQEYCQTYSSDLSTVLFPCIEIYYYDITPEKETTQAKRLALETISRTFPQKIKSLNLRIFSVPLSPQVLDAILENQSSSLRELKIEYPPHRGNLNVYHPQVISSSNYLLTNLKYLCLNAEDLDSTSNFDAQCVLTILDFICKKIPRGNPNSAKICLIGWCCALAETIALLKKYDLISFLKTLKLEFVLPGQLQVVVESGVQLEFLKLNLSHEYDGLNHEIRLFLKSQINSLKRLDWCTELYEFPTIPMNLRKLVLEVFLNFAYNGGQENGNDPPLLNQRVPILYGKCFPKLEFLKLLSSSFCQQPLSDFHSMYLVRQFPCPHLQILKLRYYRINAETINLISEIFPRIKVLDVGQYNNEESFGPEDEQMFYSALWSANFASTLEEFAIDLDTQLINSLKPRRRVWDPIQLDSFFSGLNINQIQQMDFLTLASGDSYQIQNPSILNFSNLKKLEIFAIGHVKAPGACFADFSAFALFGQLKNLEYLHVDEKVHEFKETAIEHMKRSHEIRVRILADDHSYTSTERIERAFGTDWNNTNLGGEVKRTSFNLLV